MSVIAITEGGFNPAIIVYLCEFFETEARHGLSDAFVSAGFYKSRELATRLAWVWGSQVCLETNVKYTLPFHYASPSQTQ